MPENGVEGNRMILVDYAFITTGYVELPGSHRHASLRYAAQGTYAPSLRYAAQGTCAPSLRCAAQGTYAPSLRYAAQGTYSPPNIKK